MQSARQAQLDEIEALEHPRHPFSSNEVQVDRASHGPAGRGVARRNRDDNLVGSVGAERPGNAVADCHGRPFDRERLLGARRS